jgi:hypothetical protein
MTITAHAAITCIELRLFHIERAGRSASETDAGVISCGDERAGLCIGRAQFNRRASRASPFVLPSFAVCPPALVAQAGMAAGFA